MGKVLHAPFLQTLNGQSVSCVQLAHWLLPSQKLVTQSDPARQPRPMGQAPHPPPPPSTSVSVPFLMPSVPLAFARSRGGPSAGAGMARSAEVSAASSVLVMSDDLQPTVNKAIEMKSPTIFMAPHYHRPPRQAATT